METTLRTTSKAVTWQLLGFVVMTLLGYYYTGSLSSAASLAGSSMTTGFIFYFLHEKLWQKISWGKQPV
uniref:DUF2061 domain-containing protein n=1 Tax=uncultured Thiotrichaceae bacterium TaxID=298394 RepID=A0A6S6UHI4_9GAMM|nr:MAG: Unknown protein [uncultured Thiotrichaceae bacterium]